MPRGWPNTVHLNFLQTQLAESASLRSESPAKQLFSVPANVGLTVLFARASTGPFGAPAKNFARDLARRRLERSTAFWQTSS